MTKKGCQLTLTPLSEVIYVLVFYPYPCGWAYAPCHEEDNNHPPCHPLEAYYDP